MARDVGRRVAAQLRQFADVAFAAAQQVEDLQARRLRQRLEIRRHLFERLLGQILACGGTRGGCRGRDHAPSPACACALTKHVLDYLATLANNTCKTDRIAMHPSRRPRWRRRVRHERIVGVDGAVRRACGRRPRRCGGRAAGAGHGAGASSSGGADVQRLRRRRRGGAPDVVAAQVAGAVVALRREGGRHGEGRPGAGAHRCPRGRADRRPPARRRCAPRRPRWKWRRKDFERQKQLFQTEYISQAALDRAEAQFKAAQAEAAAQLAQRRRRAHAVGLLRREGAL